MTEADKQPLKPKLTSRGQQAEAEALFSSIGEGAISTDKFGKITRVNRAGAEMLGFSENELVGSWFPKKIVAIGLDDQPINLIDQPITKAFLTGRPISEKAYYRRKSGDKIAVAITASPILLRGKPLGAIEVFRDITVEQEVDRMKSEFISLASHQLRTPLSAIKTYTHMMHDGYMGKLNASQKKALNTIIAASARMNELISTLLNITRMESGSIAVTPKVLHLDKLAEEVVKELALIASAKSIALSTATKGKGSTSLKSDALIVKEIMTNLTSNAIKYTPDSGSVELIVRPRQTEIAVEVRDSGWGIPKYSQNQVFSKFFRAQNIVKRETTGTGLGLYLVKGLVDTLGGRIRFSSEEGKGTTFIFSLPRAKRFKLQ